jgi:hypothetical protein
MGSATPLMLFASSNVERAVADNAPLQDYKQAGDKAE